MPKKSKKKRKLPSRKSKLRERKPMNLLVLERGMDRALAARKKKDLATALKHLALAQCAYQQAAEACTVHLDSLYNLGVCQSICSNIHSRRRSTVESEAAHVLAKQHF